MRLPEECSRPSEGMLILWKEDYSMILIAYMNKKDAQSQVHTHSLMSKVQVNNVLNIPTVQRKCRCFGCLPPVALSVLCRAG